MDAAGLVAEGFGQPIEGEGSVQDRTYPRLFERSDIILLLAPAANHESLQARLLGQQSDRTLPRVTTLPPDAPNVGPAADEYSGMRLAFFTLANAIK